MIEKRKHHRLDNNIPVKLCQEDGDVVTQTVNISRSGAYCRVNRFIDPMTKLKVHLLLPVRKNGKIGTKKISCQGVIVRTEPIVGTSDFNVAIFFSDITQRDAESIADFIGTYLEQEKKK